MPWTRVQPAQAQGSFAEVLQTHVLFGQPVHAGDVIVVGVIGMGIRDGFTVTDDLPGGSSAYDEWALALAPDNVATVAAYKAIAARAAPTLTVTAAVTDAVAARLGIAAVMWRKPGIVTFADSAIVTGTGVTLSTRSLAVIDPQSLLVGFGVQFDTFASPAGIAPLASQASSQSGGVFALSIADHAPQGADIAPQMGGFDVLRWVMAGAILYTAGGPPPAPKRSEPSLHGGITPMPQR